MNEPSSVLDSPWVTAGSVGLPALITFLLSRRIRGSGPVSARLARAIREKGLMREVPKGDIAKSKLQNLLQFGTSDVVAPMTLPARAARVDKPVLSSFSETPRYVKSKIRGGNIGSGKPMSGIERKDVEARIFRKATPDLYAETVRGTDIPARIRRIRDPRLRAEATQKYLNKRFGKWIMKGVDESQTGGTLLTEKANLKAVMAQALKRGPNSRMALKRTLMDKLKGMPESITYKKLKKLDADQQSIYRQRLPFLMGEEHMRTLARKPGDIIIQKRFPIKEMGAIDRGINTLTTGQPGNLELRVHAIGNKVIPSTTAHRYGGVTELGTLLGGYRPGYFSKAEKAVQRSLNKILKQNPKYVKNRAFAFDVALTPEGAVKIIESNPEGFSGFLHRSGQLGKVFDPLSAIRNQRLMSELQRQTTMPLALAQAGAAGGLGYGSLYGARKLRDALSDDS